MIPIVDELRSRPLVPASCKPVTQTTRLRRIPVRIFLLVALSTLSVFAAQERTLREWTFDRPGQFEGWQPNAQLADVGVTNGVLRFRSVGSDPILELVAPLEIRASPWQFVEVRLRTRRDGMAEWFWSNTPEGRYGGFAQEKTTRFQVRGDGAWHTWRVFPFWHTEDRIVRLRLDLFDGADFVVDTIRIGELAVAGAIRGADFTFTNAPGDWQAVGGTGFDVALDGLAIRVDVEDGFLLAPPVEFGAETHAFVNLELAVDRGRHATLLFATAETPGLQRFTFPLEPTPDLVTYNLDLLAAREWHGRIIALGLQPSDEPGARARLGWLKAGTTPWGPPRLKVKAFAPEDAVARAGGPVRVTAALANLGARPITNVQAILEVPDGVRMLAEPPESTVPPRLGFDAEASLAWTVRATHAGEARLVLRVTAENVPAQEIPLVVRFAPSLNLAKADAVPEPRPVRGPFEVGAYYFPGWRSAGQWQPLRHFPERRPALGWYREGDPEVADWHIKWAVEHGLTFFAYDWYWSQGDRQLEHALHEGYFKSKYRHLLKFCLLWANHNAPGTHSFEDCLAVTRHWIANYFFRPEHLMIEGRPVMILFSPGRLTEDLGSDGVKRAFEAMRAECRRAGLPGLFLLACVADAGEARRAAAEGYDAVTTYNWAGLGMTGGSQFAPFATLVEGYRRQWTHLRDEGSLPLMTPVSGGWDSRPWHGENNLVRYGRTPELFRRHLAEARQFIESGERKSPVENFVLIEAWNEWGEGSYIEPHQEFGFGYLDAIREVFTTAPRDHLDLVPAEVGLGPYDVPQEPAGRTAWTFDTGDEGWGNGMNLSGVTVADGVLKARTGGNDAAFFGPPLQVAAADYRFVEMRLKLTARDGRPFTDLAQLFWSTSRLSESETTSVRVPVAGDGEWHEYRLPVAGNARWRGLVTRLRFDPCSRAGVEVELDHVRLTP
ncbi:MAG: glycoside hydrolase family 99-like domain-containing protein [Limisphaerales bacterium]